MIQSRRSQVSLYDIPYYHLPKGVTIYVQPL